jgi:hypothetical protein
VHHLPLLAGLAGEPLRIFLLAASIAADNSVLFSETYSVKEMKP